MIEERFIHVFDEYYIGNDTLNMTIRRKGVIEKGKNKGNVKYYEDGFYTSPRALLNGLIRKYSIKHIKEIADTGNFINIENFVKAVEKVEYRFAQERTKRSKL